MAKIVDQYSLEEPLGLEPYGFELFRARHSQTGDLYLVKSLRKDAFESPTYFQDAVTNEIKVLKKVGHPNFIRFVKMLKTANSMYLVYEHCSGGTLFDWVNNGHLTPTDQHNYMRQLLLALTELHSAKIIHMNLHPQQIFLSHTNSIKIANFAHCFNLSEFENTAYDITHIKLTDLLAPQLRKKQAASYKSDVYTLGRIFCFIKYRKFHNYQQALNKHVVNKEPLAELIIDMVQVDPKKRPELDEVCLKFSLTTSSTVKIYNPTSHISRSNIQSQRKSSEQLITLQNQSSTKRTLTKIDSATGQIGCRSNRSAHGKSIRDSHRSDHDNSDTKSVIAHDYEDNVISNEAKKLRRERLKYTFLVMSAQNIIQENLCANSSKISFLITKKALLIGLHLTKSLIKPKEKGHLWQQLQTMTKIIGNQTEQINQLYKKLKQMIVSEEKTLLSDSAFELQIEEDDSLNEAFFRKMIRQLINTTFPKIGDQFSNTDPYKRDKDAISRKLLLHLNQLSDIKDLDKFFTNYINDSVINIADQVYFEQVQKMQLKDLHRLVSEKIM